MVARAEVSFSLACDLFDGLMCFLLSGCGCNSAKDDRRLNKIFAGRKYSSKVRAGVVKTKLLDPKLTETMVKLFDFRTLIQCCNFN